MPDRKVKYWGDGDSEVLIYTTEDEAIEHILDVMQPFPEQIEIVGFAEMKPPRVEDFTGNFLETILENLDEEYGNPDNTHYTEPTENMKKAEEAFIKAVLDDYEPYVCEEITRKTINVREWVTAHRPDWSGTVIFKKD